MIAAPATQHHHAIGMRVLESGLPLLMEKPLADTLADAEDLVARSRLADVPLMCGLLERYNPGIVTAMSLLKNPLQITAQRHSPYVARIRTGVASDLLIHDADIVVRMMGSEPSRVLGSMGYLHPESEPTSEDVAEALMSFPGGAVANVSASRMSQRKVRGFVTTCSATQSRSTVTYSARTLAMGCRTSSRPSSRSPSSRPIANRWRPNSTGSST